jgi:hypothetical protein
MHIIGIGDMKDFGKGLGRCLIEYYAVGGLIYPRSRLGFWWMVFICAKCFGIFHMLYFDRALFQGGLG